MIRTLTAFTLLIGVTYGWPWSWNTPTVNVKFELSLLGLGTSSFIQLPLSVDAATASGWVQYARPEGPAGYSALTLYCSNDDLTVGVLYDDTGYVAGLQIALNQEYVSDAAYDWAGQGFTEWTPTLSNGTQKSYYAINQYYTSADYLAIDSATRIAGRSTETILQDENIWVTGFNGELYNISTNTDYITDATSDYTEQACIPWMGRHYYYKMTSSLECGAGKIFPWFPLTYSDRLVGVGFMVFAKYNAQRDWFEEPSESDVKMIVPSGPDCLYELAASPGVITMHTYFVSPAQTITCVFE